MLQQAIVLLSYIPNVLSVALQVAAKVLMYYVKCYNKLHSSGIMHDTIVLLVQKSSALYKGPGL